MVKDSLNILWGIKSVPFRYLFVVICRNRKSDCNAVKIDFNIIPQIVIACFYVINLQRTNEAFCFYYHKFL